jgi:hypothetical protein
LQSDAFHRDAEQSGDEIKKQAPSVQPTNTDGGCKLLQAFGNATTCLQVPTWLSPCADEKIGENSVFTRASPQRSRRQASVRLLGADAC